MSERLYVQYDQIRQLVDVTRGKEGEEAEEEDASSVWLVGNCSDDSQNESIHSRVLSVECRIESP